MGLRDDIAQAQLEAITKAATKGLVIERKKVASLSQMLDRNTTLSAVVTPSGAHYGLVLPFAPKGTLESALYEAVGAQMREHDEAASPYTFNGNAAYSFTKPLDTQSLAVTACGLAFTIDVIPAVLHQKKSRRASRNIADVFFVSDVADGEEFDIILRREGALEYNLIPVSKGVRDKFPGYQVPFTLTHGAVSIETYVTNAGSGAKKGERKGSYVTKGVGKIYALLPDLATGDILRIRYANPGKYEVLGARKPSAE
jgi:hypothetical protein